ncbi:SGNH/GDSL hydrolase family protein [Aestuariibaculum suncheonense]|uniref:Endoglucanase E n=1 Tax=Aestuariibaculum suncheonense TaxID=1028745 RepID=A0A8J6UAV6_9FLAO|nr:SGNH/GDSL hydrolase family protein [Aestuariibaculum suncheonense]MBD0834797.1 hypothetical protein [Aestuariibaculum suncheonense]
MMRNIGLNFYILVLLVIFCNIAHATTGFGSLTDSNIEYVGRWDKCDKNVFRSYWGGAYLKVTFTGRTIKIKLAKAANIYVSVDGLGYKKYSNAKGVVDLTPNILQNEIHTLVVVANYANDEIHFQGFILEKEGITLAQPEKDIIEFVGNSITSGQNTTMGNLSAYPWLTGEALQVDHTQISQPGITLVDGYYYNANWAPKRGQSVQYFLMKTSNHEISSTWNFSVYTPKVLVINIGTNDYNLKVPNELFESTYQLFVQRIRRKYPNTEIFLMETFAGYYTEEIRNVVNMCLDSGDSKIHFVETKNWLLKPNDYVDQNHPNDIGHKKIAEKLSEVLKDYIN